MHVRYFVKVLTHTYKKSKFLTKNLQKVSKQQHKSTILFNSRTLYKLEKFAKLKFVLGSTKHNKSEKDVFLKINLIVLGSTKHNEGENDVL